MIRYRVHVPAPAVPPSLQAVRHEYRDLSYQIRRKTPCFSYGDIRRWLQGSQKLQIDVYHILSYTLWHA